MNIAACYVLHRYTLSLAQAYLAYKLVVYSMKVKTKNEIHLKALFAMIKQSNIFVKCL